MIVAIHQPDYIPYIGYFYKIKQCDCFVFLDDAQYSNTGYTNWNTIKTAQGKQRLKIPVNQTLGDSILNVSTKDELKWKKKHLTALICSYARSKYFDEIFNNLQELLVKDYCNIADMNIEIIKDICRRFQMDKKFVCSSEMNINSRKEERILDICNKLAGNVYLSGQGARVYQEGEHFSKRGVKLVYTNYKPVVYEQMWGAFIPNLSIVDYLFNYGYDWEKIEASIKG